MRKTIVSVCEEKVSKIAKQRQLDILHNQYKVIYKIISTSGYFSSISCILSQKSAALLVSSHTRRASSIYWLYFSSDSGVRKAEYFL